MRGFTLIELLIYTALAGMFLTGVTYFAIGLLNGQAKTLVEQEVNDNLRNATRRIVFEIRNAQGINSLTSNDLCLQMSNATYNPTRVYLSSSLGASGALYGVMAALAFIFPNTEFNIYLIGY